MNELVAGSEPPAEVRRLDERGLTTVEYAIGLLAAATVAILLVRVFSDNAVLQVMQDWVISIFGRVINGGFNVQDLFSWNR